MVLNSYHSGCQYELIEDAGPPHNRQFVFKVEVLGVAYTGKGSSKKRAKQACAAAALKSIYNINLSLGMETPESGLVPVWPPSSAEGSEDSKPTPLPIPTPKSKKKKSKSWSTDYGIVVVWVEIPASDCNNFTG